MGKLQRLWSWVSHLNTFFGLLTTLPALGGYIGIIGGGTVTWIGSYGPAIGFLLVVGGLVGGVWFVNGLRWLDKGEATPDELEPASAIGEIPLQGRITERLIAGEPSEIGGVNRVVYADPIDETQSPATVDTEDPITKPLEMQAMREKLRFLELSADLWKRPAGWMNTMMVEDRENLSNGRSVTVTGYRVLVHHLNDREPYLQFMFDVINRSVFKVTIGVGPIYGTITWRDSELRSQPKPKDNKSVELIRGHDGVFELQQDVLRETASAILKAHNQGQEVEFTFRGLLIPLKAYAPDGTTADEGKLAIQQGGVRLPPIRQ